MSSVKEISDFVYQSNFTRLERTTFEMILCKLEDQQREIEALKAAQQQQPKVELVAEPAKPTPGEWRYDAVDRAVRSNKLTIGASYRIADSDEHHANGRLMAASKRMYELLKDVKKHFIGGAIPGRIDAIIKEVEGR